MAHSQNKGVLKAGMYLDGLVAVRLVTLEGSGVLLHDGVLLERSDHFLWVQKNKIADQSFCSKISFG